MNLRAGRSRVQISTHAGRWTRSRARCPAMIHACRLARAASLGKRNLLAGNYEASGRAVTRGFCRPRGRAKSPSEGTRSGNGDPPVAPARLSNLSSPLLIHLEGPSVDDSRISGVAATTVTPVSQIFERLVTLHAAQLPRPPSLSLSLSRSLSRKRSSLRDTIRYPV